MIKKTTIVDIKKSYNYAHDVERVLDNSDNSQIFWKWPAEIGTGNISRIKLNPGLSLGLGDFQVFQDFELRVEPTPLPVVIHFSSSRHTDCGGYSLIDKQNELCFYEPGLGGSIDYRREWRGVFKFSRGVRIRGIAVYIDPLLLTPLMAGQIDRFPAHLRDIACGDLGQSFNQAFIMPPAADIAINQVLACPYTGALKRFFLEAKVMELITYAMAQLTVDQYNHGRIDALPPRDIERIYGIKEILLNNLDNPPSLMELARKSGINKTKLNTDFRKVFGSSVFEFLRTSRLEHARTLLENNKMSVTETAFEVGYAHQQSFTRAFKNHFGTTPIDHIS